MPESNKPHPAKDEGYKAFYAGKDQSINPYDPNEEEHLDWNDGYSKAEEESGSL